MGKVKTQGGKVLRRMPGSVHKYMICAIEERMRVKVHVLTIMACDTMTEFN